MYIKKSIIFFCIALVTFSVSGCFLPFFGQEEEDNTPVGELVLDYGENEVFGTVYDGSSTVLSDTLLKVSINGLFAVIAVKTDAQGNYSIKGLPDLSFANEFDFNIVYNKTGYERVSYWPIAKYNLDTGFTLTHGSSIEIDQLEMNIDIYEIAPDTVFRGRITNRSGSPMLPSNMSLIEVTRGNDYIQIQGPAFNPTGNEKPSFNTYYNTETGEFVFKNCLAGGQYRFHVLTYPESIYESLHNIDIYITPGTTIEADFILMDRS
jgi:hypothetical protein